MASTADMERVALRLQRSWRQREWQRALDEYAAVTGMIGEPRALAAALEQMRTDVETGQSSKDSILQATLRGRDQRVRASTENDRDEKIRRALSGEDKDRETAPDAVVGGMGAVLRNVRNAQRPFLTWRMGSDRSLNADMNLLQGAIGKIAPISETEELANAGELQSGKLKYEVLSLRTKQQRKSAVRIAVGWLLNVTFLLALLQTFLLYVCEFNARGVQSENYLMHRELILAWGWSVLQRMFLNEPLVILTSKGLPMLLKSKVCSCLVSETCVEYLSQGIETFGEFTRALMG